MERTSIDCPAQPAARWRLGGAILVVARAGVLALGAVLAIRYGAWGAIIVLAAAWVPWEPRLGCAFRFGLAVVAVPILCLALYALLGIGFLGYGLAYGTSYEPGPLPIVGDYQILCNTTAGGRSEERDLLPGLQHARYHGPYSIHIGIWTSLTGRMRARLTDVQVRAAAGSLPALPVDLVCYVAGCASKPLAEWNGFEGYIGGAADVDLDSLGPEVVVTFTLHVDREGATSKYPVQFALHRRGTTASGITVSSP